MNPWVETIVVASLCGGAWFAASCIVYAIIATVIRYGIRRKGGGHL